MLKCQKMSSCQKDVKCQNIKHLDYGGGSKKRKLTQWGSQILTSILTSHMMLTKNPQNVHRKYFWPNFITFICDVKIDINICEHHYVNLFSFVNILHSPNVWLFEIWHFLDSLTPFGHFNTGISLKWPQPITELFLNICDLVLWRHFEEEVKYTK